MPETKVRIRKLIRDLRDQYPYGAVLAMLIETIGNSIDAHANEIRIEIDRKNYRFRAVDNGIGMKEDEFIEYHNIAAQTKTRGVGIGFAGVGAKIFLDEPNNEAYVADGYGNHRVAVIDMDTGKIKRYWGAYGEKPDDEPLGRYVPTDPPAKQFRTPVHCAELSKDNFVYVCDRPNDRIQVFTKDGKYVKETFVEKNTLGDGSTWDIAFSKDPQQKYLYLADGANEKVHVFDRESMNELTSFGDGGRQPGQFYAVHSIATDSKGNIYTTETYRGQRVQRFMYKGIGTVAKLDQGTVWPRK